MRQFFGESLVGMFAGLGFGLALVSWISFMLERCRFGWHQWGVWAFAVDGKSQFRVCKKCFYNEAQMFRDKESHEPLTRTQVPATSAASAPTDQSTTQE